MAYITAALSFADAQALSFAQFGPGTGPIFLDDVACTGTETMLLSCPNSGVGVHNCVHGEDASVRCSQDCKYTHVLWLGI